MLLRGLRDQVAVQVAGSMQRRGAAKERLRAALNGDDDTACGPSGSSARDQRAAAPDR